MSHAEQRAQRMISYAQNFEDVILARLFKGQQSGFYVDIGACHPVNDSVTNHFYQLGWRGINVEPQPQLHAALIEQRPKDLNLKLCIGGQKTKGTLHITHDLGTSTLDADLANAYQAQNRVSSTCQIELITLNDLWREHVKEQAVNFLKIDVEGLEAEILSATDFDLVNPDLILIESIDPQTKADNHERWLSYLTPRYQEYYFDGLNRFYIRKGHLFNSARPCLPPNIFDNFVTVRELAITRELDKASHAYQTALETLKSKDAALLHCKEAYDAIAAMLHIKQQEIAQLHAQLRPSKPD